MRTRQKLFCQEYASCWNATEAARRAGYSPRSAASIGWENLQKPEIRQEIERRIAAEELSANEVLMRLAQQARGEAAEFIADDGSFELERLRAAGKAHLIKSIKRTQYGLQVEFHDAQDALLQIGRYYGLFKDRIETRTGVTFAPETVAEAERLLREFGEEIRQQAERSNLLQLNDYAESIPTK